MALTVEEIKTIHANTEKLVEGYLADPTKVNPLRGFLRNQFTQYSKAITEDHNAKVGIAVSKGETIELLADGELNKRVVERIRSETLPKLQQSFVQAAQGKSKEAQMGIKEISTLGNAMQGVASGDPFSIMGALGSIGSVFAPVGDWLSGAFRYLMGQIGAQDKISWNDAMHEVKVGRFASDVGGIMNGQGVDAGALVPVLLDKNLEGPKKTPVVSPPVMPKAEGSASRSSTHSPTQEALARLGVGRIDGVTGGAVGFGEFTMAEADEADTNKAPLNTGVAPMPGNKGIASA